MNLEKLNKNNLINSYNKLEKNINNEQEYYALTDIIENMYTNDLKIATRWSINALNKYTSSLTTYKKTSSIYAALNTLIDTIIILLIRYHGKNETKNIINNNILKKEDISIISTYLSN